MSFAKNGNEKEITMRKFNSGYVLNEKEFLINSFR